jgi:hypothetical protein
MPIPHAYASVRAQTERGGLFLVPLQQFVHPDEMWRPARSTYWYYRLDLETICARCGVRAGAHAGDGAYCPVMRLMRIEPRAERLAVKRLWKVVPKNLPA